MSPQEQRLAQDRATRDAARAVFDTRLERVRDALAERSLGARVLDEAVDTAASGAEQALAVARESRGIAAGTALALAAWLLRRPLGRLAGRLAGRLGGQLLRRMSDGEPASRWARWRAWTVKRIRT